MDGAIVLFQCSHSTYLAPLYQSSSALPGYVLPDTPGSRNNLVPKGWRGN